MNRQYIRRHKAGTWFLQRRGYVMFMIRELTAVFIALYAVLLLTFLAALGQGEEKFTEVLAIFTQPGWRIWHTIVLIGALWHAVTWFNLTPAAMPVFLGEKKAPGPAVAIAMGYAPWVVVSALVIWLVWV